MKTRHASLMLAVIVGAAAPQCGDVPVAPTAVDGGNDVASVSADRSAVLDPAASMSVVPRSDVSSSGSRVPVYVPPPDGGGGVGGCYEISHQTACTGTAPTCATCTTWLQCPSGIAVKEVSGYCPGDSYSCVFNDLCH